MKFAFIGRFADTTPDTIFTTEYSVRTGMEAAYRLLDIDRGVPEVFNSTHDLRFLLEVTSVLRDGDEVELPGPKFVGNWIIKRLDHTQIG